MFPTLDAVTADSAEALRAALARTADSTGPQFVCVECDPHEIPPFAPFLSAAAQLTGGADDRHDVAVG
jgi:acetolactate synthase I/II/III large subunit